MNNLTHKERARELAKKCAKTFYTLFDSEKTTEFLADRLKWITELLVKELDLANLIQKADEKDINNNALKSSVNRLFNYLNKIGCKSMIENSCPDTASIMIDELRRQLLMANKSREKLVSERDSYKQKAETLDCIITSFMRQSNGYDLSDINFRWLIELPMTDEEHDNLLSIVKATRK